VNIFHRIQRVLSDRKAAQYRPVIVKELPTHLEQQTVYIVGEGRYRWFAALLCPCGCNEIIYLNLRADSHPCWLIKEHIGTISIEPSIQRLKGCGSHFFIKKGRVQWYRSN